MGKFNFFGSNVSNSIIMHDSGKTIINGISYDVPRGASITVNNGKVIINGKDVSNDFADAKEINITIQGYVESIEANNNILIEGNVGVAKSGNNLSVSGDILGSASAGNNIKANDIHGSANAGNNIYSDK